MGFKQFLLTENKKFFGKKIGEIVNSLADIGQDAPNLGARHLVRLAEKEVNNLRSVLKKSWSEQIKQDYLPDVQRVAYNLAKTIEDKGDLRDVLPQVLQDLENLSGRLGVKMNQLQSVPVEGGEDIGPNDFDITGQGPEEQPQQPEMMPQDGQPEMMPQQPMMPQAGF
jgi:hypothetical protein